MTADDVRALFADFYAGLVLRPPRRRLARHQLGEDDELLRHRVRRARPAARRLLGDRQSGQRRGGAGRAEHEPDVRARREDGADADGERIHDGRFDSRFQARARQAARPVQTCSTQFDVRVGTIEAVEDVVGSTKLVQADGQLRRPPAQHPRRDEARARRTRARLRGGRRSSSSTSSRSGWRAKCPRGCSSTSATPTASCRCWPSPKRACPDGARAG